VHHHRHDPRRKQLQSWNRQDRLALRYRSSASSRLLHLSTTMTISSVMLGIMISPRVGLRTPTPIRTKMK